MSERHDSDDPRDDDAEPSDSTDRISSRQALQREKTSGLTRDSRSDRTTEASADHGGDDETDRKPDPRRAEPRGPPTAERFEELVSQVSHDLTSQLTVARGRLDMARQEVDNDDLAKVATALDRMETLVEDLQEGAATGTELTELERIPLPALADQCWRNVAASGGTLHNASTLTLQADPSSLKRVLENLFRNAVEHNDADVRVEVGDLDETGGFYVADDGSGISDHVSDALFEPGISTGRDGSGLGLSIVARIVESHDWHVRVTESEAGGARFEVTGIESVAT